MSGLQLRHSYKSEQKYCGSG
uniref:Uncharacterized protein n=1 Tax=Rhizophora mucronata TaxID=61149 RepID=A0A2P2N6J7_RHIMU